MQHSIDTKLSLWPSKLKFIWLNDLKLEGWSTELLLQNGALLTELILVNNVLELNGADPNVATAILVW